MRLLVLALIAAVIAGGGSPAEAGKKKRRYVSPEKKVCRTVKGKRRCKWVPRFEGHGVARADLRAEPVERPSGELAFEPNHKPGTVFRGSLFDDAGELDDAVLAELDRGFACKRTGDLRAVDPRLYQTMSTIYDHFGKKTIVLVSGHRLQRNDKSRHFHAAAMDIYIPGVSIEDLYEYAQSLDTGGMGIGLYPRSGFVHIDYRAPGSASYRWTDWSGGKGKKGKGKGKGTGKGKKRGKKTNA